MSIHIQSLHVYPVKSLQGIDLQQADIGPRGIRWDRHWMLVDASGKFISQRQNPKLASISTRMDSEYLYLSAKNMPEQAIPLQRNVAENLIPVQIWNDQCLAKTESPDIDAWLHRALGISCRLVHLPADQIRPVDPEFATPQDQVGFADAFPLLVLSQAAAELLSEKMRQPVPINRFRANIVVTGIEAHAEDQWHEIKIADLNFRLPKLCSRCVIPSIDQLSGEKHLNPNSALSKYRRFDNKIYVGKNAIADGEGQIRCGDPVHILAQD